MQITTIDKFELAMNASKPPRSIDRFDMSKRPRLYAFYRRVEETRLLQHAFRKLNVRKGGRCKYLLTNLRANLRNSESESECESESERESESESYDEFKERMYNMPRSIYRRSYPPH